MGQLVPQRNGRSRRRAALVPLTRDKVGLYMFNQVVDP
jgi:hypothetical protein